MYPLLILRAEFASFIILLLLICTARNHRFLYDSDSFLQLAWLGLGHVFFDIITVFTVNNMHIIPGWLNGFCHRVFYVYSIFFSYKLCSYTASVCRLPKCDSFIHRYGRIIVALYCAALPFLPIRYVQGRGTMYSSGTAVAVTYILAMLFFLFGAIMITAAWKKLHNASANPQKRLLTIILVLMGGELLQVFIPELLFTGVLATIIMVAFFFISLDNPVEALENKLQKDALTGLGSRHSYDAAIKNMETCLASDPSTTFGVVFCDMNNLKYVNDVLGHAEGDNYISNIALLLSANLVTADQIYRIGGDEFVATYINKSAEIIKKEIQLLHKRCEEEARMRSYDMSIATGFAMTGSELTSVRDVIETADHRMCFNKSEQKRRKNHEKSQELNRLNVSGLTDRVFDAFACSSDRSYLFLHNMQTGVTRISTDMVKHFGLPGEYILNFDNVWCPKIHPDDQQRYMSSINEIHSGKTKHHEIEYRAQNLQGEYDFCSCTANVLPGKDGDPDLFAGTIINHSLQERVDALTGLPNKIAYEHRLVKLIDNHEAAALLKLSITSFSRVNLVYGHNFGDDVILLFSDFLRKIVADRGEIYRLDGTKFGLVLPNAATEEVDELYKKIQFAANHKITTSYMNIPLRLAGGAYMKTADFIGTESTIRSNLMFAYEHSKDDHYGSLQYYRDPTAGNGDYALLSAIHRDAIGKRSGFYLRYQPIVDSNTEKIVGAEALLRWHNMEYGEVPPMKFIEWLENDPCYFDLGGFILKQALTDAAEMRKHYPGFTINVNITILQLQHELFHEQVKAALRETGFPAEQLVLEMTERCRALDEDFLRKEIEYFHSIGVKSAMDDIGTGSSAFALILRLPIDEVKLDRVFVNRIQSIPSNQAFVQSVIDISREKSYSICFEGLEDESTRNYLKRYPNTLFQGYFYSKPLLVQEFRDLMKKQKKKQLVAPFTSAENN